MGHFMDDQEIEGHAKTQTTGKPVLQVVPQKKLVCCSFCGKERGDVRYLISNVNTNAHICDECLKSGQEVGEREFAQRAPHDR